MFFRELISNAADALDKRRFLSLQDPAQAGSAAYEISIDADPDSRILRIRDTGIGMDEADLRTNLGVIAKSGTAAFLESLAGEGASGVSQIGQFGAFVFRCFLVDESRGWRTAWLTLWRGWHVHMRQSDWLTDWLTG